MDQVTERDKDAFHAAVRLARAGKRREALRAFEALAHRFPNWPQVHHNLGSIYRAAVDRRRAILAYERVLALRPGFAATLNDFAGLLTDQGEYARAETLYLRQLEVVERGKEWAHYNFALLRERQARDADAEAQYRAALAIRPDFASAHYNLGLLLLKQRRTDEAADAFRAATVADPEHVSARQMLAQALTDLKQWREAGDAWEEALRLHPNDLKVNRNAVVCLLVAFAESRHRGYLDRATERAWKCVSLSPLGLPNWWLLWECLKIRALLDEQEEK